MLQSMVMVFGQMNEPPGGRFRVGHAALTMAEYFRDDEHRDVLLLIDNIFRFIQAGMEVSGLMGRMPSRLGYQPTMGTELSGLEERIANTDSGAITSIQAVYVPADDFTDPAAVHTFSHLSASIVLSRKRASEGLFPAIDPLQSSSRWHTRHRRRNGIMALRSKSAERSHNTRNSRTSLPCWVWSSFHRKTVPWSVGPGVWSGFSRSHFSRRSNSPGSAERLVSLEDALEGCERILNDEFKIIRKARCIRSGQSARRSIRTRRNMPRMAMNLKILLPFKVFAEIAGVSRIVAETREGSFGILPHRLDCAAAIAPGILTYESTAGGEVFVAVDEGVLVKAGQDVLVSVRRALHGANLGVLREAVEREFRTLDERERSLRSMLAKMEGELIRRLASFHNVR